MKLVSMSFLIFVDYVKVRNFFLFYYFKVIYQVGRTESDDYNDIFKINFQNIVVEKLIVLVGKFGHFGFC